MIQILLGILAGMCLPAQTSINTRLRKSVGSPFFASFLSFMEAWLLLLILLLIMEGSRMIGQFGSLRGEPLWIYAGGICGVIFLTGNILLFPRLGGVQIVVLSVLGQIVMGLVIDSFGLFRSAPVPLSAVRILGAFLVFAGVVVVSLAKNGSGDKNRTTESGGIWIWLFRVLGVGIGMLSATQTATNGYLGKILNSPVGASVISFTVGTIFLGVVCALVLFLRKGRADGGKPVSAGPAWMWIGGLLGAIFILTNVYLSRLLGTGMTVIVILLGTTTGGLIVDHFGLFESPVKPVNLQKLIGVTIMIAGVVLIRIL